MTTFFSKVRRCRAGISLSARFSTSTCQIDGLAMLDKMTRCSTSGPRDHRTWPFVTFSFGGTWRTESTYLHYPQPWMSFRNASLQLGHAGLAAESLVRARLSHRCLPSNKRGARWACDTKWNRASLCNCSHQFWKNIPVSFDFITTWNQGVFLCSPCTIYIPWIHETVTRQ